MSRVICVCNQKGGTGKTTTVANLGIGLARAGKRVLLIDGDSQGSLTASLGYRDPDSLDISLATIMEKLINEDEMNPKEGILHHPEGIDLMPANIELAALEVSMVNIIGRERILKNYIQLVEDSYDYIITDCNPSLGMITINALACANSVLIPVQSSFLPVKGLQQLIKTIGIVKRQLNEKLQIEGILLTMVDGRTSFSKDICDMVRDTYGDKVRIFKENIPRSVRAEETTAEGVSIFVHDKNGKVARAYQALAEEVLAND
ncbi:MAG: ParA family protein [Marvinbryantia sp.]|jgi:chromosome partitioning protein